MVVAGQPSYCCTVSLRPTSCGTRSFRALLGHDRGGRVACRLALDHPKRVDRLAVLDIVPVSEAFRRADVAFVLNFWPWSLLSQPYPVPERLVGGAPEAVLEATLHGWSVVEGAFPDEVCTEYRRALGNPETIHAICEELSDGGHARLRAGRS
jgi:haloacetate dehalogenase